MSLFIDDRELHRRWLRQAGAALCASIAVIGWFQFPAYGSVVPTERTIAIISIPELNMLRPIEGIDKIDSSPRENDPLTVFDCSYAGSSSYGDVFYECEGCIWCHEPLAELPVWHLKIQRRLMQNLELGGHAMCYLARWRLAGIDYLNFNDEFITAVVRDDSAGLNTKIGPQLVSSGPAANHSLPKPEEGKNASDNHEPFGKARQASGIGGYQALIFVLLGFGVVFQIVGLRILEDGRIFFGAILAGFGFILTLYSGFAAVSANISEHLKW